MSLALHPEHREEDESHDEEPDDEEPPAEYRKKHQKQSHTSLSVLPHFKSDENATQKQQK